MIAEPTEHIRTACPRCLSVFRVARRYFGFELGCPRCGTPWKVGEAGRSSDTDPRIGRRLGNYRITGVLGRGPVSVVYEARDRAIERKVAIKLLDEARAADPAVLQNFILEAREAARLTDPNVVRIQHVGADTGTYFVVMELVEGGSAADYIVAHGAMDPAEATRVILDTARAVASAHAQGIVHRNIKPSNILCGRDGLVKLADFGLEKRSDCGPLLSANGRPLGSALFMSPEHFLNDLLEPRSDVYSLGCVYYCLLTGRAPFEASTLVNVANLHLNAKIPDPSQLNPAVPSACGIIIAKCLAKEPDKRYPSVDALIADLEALGLTHAPDNLGGIRFTDFAAAQTSQDADSLLLLPEIDPGANGESSAGFGSLLPRPPAPTTRDGSSTVFENPTPRESPVSTPAGDDAPRALAAYLVPAALLAILVGLVTAVVIRVYTSGDESAAPEPKSKSTVKTDFDGLEDAPPPRTRNEKLEFEAEAELERLADLADRKELSLKEVNRLIALFEVFLSRYGGTAAEQNAVHRLSKLHSMAAELEARLKSETGPESKPEPKEKEKEKEKEKKPRKNKDKDDPKDKPGDGKTE